jgi:hypothetical protein
VVWHLSWVARPLSWVARPGSEAKGVACSGLRGGAGGARDTCVARQSHATSKRHATSKGHATRSCHATRRDVKSCDAIKGEWPYTTVPSRFRALPLHRPRLETSAMQSWCHSRTLELFAIGLAITFAMVTIQSAVIADEDDGFDKKFSSDVLPLLQRYCDHCHGGPEPEAKFDTTHFVDVRAIRDRWHSWEDILRRLTDREMPPPNEELQPTDAEREQFLKWSQAFKQQEMERHRDDPGPLSLRRLSVAEWNNTIRDLVGHDIRPARDFPVDPANEAGFDNSAESLTISPALVQKYLNAARFVADHMLLTPDGIRFAPYPVSTETDRDRYCVQRIVDFYERQPTNLTAYLVAASSWSRGSNDHTDEALISFSEKAAISPKYLNTLLTALHDPEVQYGPLKEVQIRWQSLLDEALSEQEVAQGCEELRRYIVGQREKLSPQVENLRAPGGINGGSQPLVLWKNRELAANRRRCRSDGFTDDPEQSVLPLDLRRAYGSLGEPEKVKILNDYEKFCSTFPNTFYVAERGRAHIAPQDAAKEAKGRLLSAGFHSMMGYFRDDQPLYELILSEQEQQELDRLWDELDFIAEVPVRQYAGHLWFERAEASFLTDDRFDFVRAEDKNASSSEMMAKFAKIYLEKLREKSADEQVVAAVEYYFREMDQRLRKLENDRQAAEVKQLDSLLKMIESIYRRPVGPEVVERWRDFYRDVRQLPTANHRTALEDTLVSLLLSPQHLYRWDLGANSPAVVALDGDELAARWSYFLWASSPDTLLRQGAMQDELLDREGISRQLQRMVHDARFEGMVREFLGNWLDFRRFESHNGVDRNQFPEFDDAMRQAMFDEPIQYFMDLMRRDGQLIELIDSNYVVVNKPLAKFYGLKASYDQIGEEWQRLETVAAQDRGGLISMSVFLTQNSPGLRTSPVKRGYWVVRKILGEKIPAPPPNVPELPNSEHDLGELTLRQVLQKHREHPSCAGCHARFDSFGLLLEGFDPIGRPRKQDLAGHTISAAATLPDGNDANGIVGLRNYIKSQRADDFRRHFCESLVAYGLGRGLILSDQLLVEEMLAALRRENDRVSAPFKVLLQSPQFQKKRGAEPRSQESEDVAR